MPQLMQEKERQEKVKDIIREGRLIVHFQPIVSISRKTVVGVEGLIRGVGEDGRMISPLALFEMAQKEDAVLELDRACREKTLEAFRPLYEQDKTKLLFLNLDVSVLDKAAGSNYLLNQVKKHCIALRNVVIEINETKVSGSAPLMQFCDTYKKLGFMVALDDVGIGFSNMDRILLVRPDIIKIDISLIQNIEHDYGKQGIFQSLINMANIIGALVIAEGVETEEEVIQILRLGGKMIQGYYFAKPQEADSFAVFESGRIEETGRAFNDYMRAKISEEQKRNRKLDSVVTGCIKKLSVESAGGFNGKLLEITWSHSDIECAYILDENGIQISNTIRYCSENDVKDNLIFYSASAGSDHTMERYYYPLISARLKKYVTEPYLSLATGNICITVSKVFAGADGKKYILCIDFNTTDWYEPDSVKCMSVSNLVFNINGKSITEINRMINRMNEEIIRDSLTNTYNRRYMEERLLVDVFNAVNDHQPISVILADLDHFKKINDTYGHIAGDTILKEFARIVKSNIRKNNDWIARYGGEEFLIVLLNAERDAACGVAEKIRQALEKAEISHQKEKIRVTASFGVSTMEAQPLTYEELIEQADRNLYLAKSSGRNKTSC